MAEKRKTKKKREELDAPSKIDKPSKTCYTVAKWLRKNVPSKKTKFLSHNVEYFTGSKAIDALMESHFAAEKDGKEPLFATRSDAVQFLNEMLVLKFFHRARKVPVSEQELKAKLKKKEPAKKKEDDESSHTECERKDETTATLEGKDKEKDKKKRKIRLEMHMEQVFADCLDAYVWIYDPIPVYYWFFGSLLVVGAIAICLFPLWPPVVRKGVYYLSVAAAGFLIFIIALAILRVLVFCLLWALTLGKHHLWLLPNLTEDVGFLPSFWPLYQYEYKGKKSGDKSKKKKKAKDSDAEEEEETTKLVEEENTGANEGEIDNSASESESSQKSQTGKDFEMVEHEEVTS
ncbi:translocation protein SEC62 [Neocloeon triangulifer]|uniref:translocation protein SEC62 n=1 Tax=Neocloeon triangulifer TaxID=2078957 RepID=UPI00286EC69E|nr:translocation protein SEC62 [Neocloeon triangulifer]